MEQHIRRLTKTANHSHYLVLPQSILKKYGWREKQKLVIVDRGRGRLEVRDWRRK